MGRPTVYRAMMSWRFEASSNVDIELESSEKDCRMMFSLLFHGYDVTIVTQRVARPAPGHIRTSIPVGPAGLVFPNDVDRDADLLGRHGASQAHEE